MLNLHHLSIFHAVAKTKSVSRAAERLMISQPAVSKQLRIMETAIKNKLFDRHSKGVSLTSTGAMLAGYTQRIFGLIEEAERIVSDITSLRRGSLAIGAGPTVGVYLLPKTMVRFRREHPDVHLHWETEGAEVLRQRLLDGLIELAISETPVNSSELSSKVLMNDVLVPVVAKNHELANHSSPGRWMPAPWWREPCWTADRK
jgi:DNA-binding transcriptional LysR family regulator